MNLREAAYSTVPKLTVEDVAREMAVARDFVLRECLAGNLKQEKDGTITGVAFARYLSQRKQG